MKCLFLGEVDLQTTRQLTTEVIIDIGEHSHGSTDDLFICALLEMFDDVLDQIGLATTIQDFLQTKENAQTGR